MSNYDQSATDARFAAMWEQYDVVAGNIAATYPNAFAWSGLYWVPWGDTEDEDCGTVSGFVLDVDVDEGNTDAGPAIRVGIYDNYAAGDDPLALVHTYTATDALDLIDGITELQPEGTNWADWAAHYATEIWGVA